MTSETTADAQTRMSANPNDLPLPIRRTTVAAQCNPPFLG